VEAVAASRHRSPATIECYVLGVRLFLEWCQRNDHRAVLDRPTVLDKDKDWVEAKLVKAFGHPDLEQGLCNAKSLAAQLDKNYPSAAASLREGLEEMFTLARLGQDPHYQQPHQVNDLDSPHHQPQRHPLARRPDGAALDRRGHAQRRTNLPPHQGLQTDAPQLIEALRRQAHPDTVTDAESVGAAA
jgi:putative transposase